MDVTVSTHWHNDLLGRETLLADLVGSFIHSWPIFSLSSRKVNPLRFPLLLPLVVLYLLDYAVTDLWVHAYATRVFVPCILNLHIPGNSAPVGAKVWQTSGIIPPAVGKFV